MVHSEGTDWRGSFINTYRLTLGDFEMAGYKTIDNGFFWVLFFIGTIVSMLILLNMVIAVMSEAF